jgi:hypothetical protein
MNLENYLTQIALISDPTLLATSSRLQIYPKEEEATLHSTMTLSAWGPVKIMLVAETALFKTHLKLTYSCLSIQHHRSIISYLLNLIYTNASLLSLTAIVWQQEKLNCWLVVIQQS